MNRGHGGIIPTATPNLLHLIWELLRPKTPLERIERELERFERETNPRAHPQWLAYTHLLKTHLNRTHPWG